MALIKCKECGTKVSKKADKCPMCGAPIPKGTSAGTILVVILLLVVAYSYFSSDDVSKPVAPQPAPALTAQQKSEKITEIVAKLKKVPSSDIAKNLSLYRTLTKLKPDDENFKQKISFYEKKNAEAERERARITALNKLGIWSIGNYIDDFGDKTGERFISTTITGTFSNTATQDSSLTIRFLISNKNEITLKLFEYAGNNPVKNYGNKDKYKILVKDNDGNRLRLKATNYSDRLSLDKKHSEQLSNAFLKGGKVKFSITEIDTPTTVYNFTINNALYYNNALRKLNEKS